MTSTTTRTGRAEIDDGSGGGGDNDDDGDDDDDEKGNDNNLYNGPCVIYLSPNDESRRQEMLRRELIREYDTFTVDDTAGRRRRVAS